MVVPNEVENIISDLKLAKNCPRKKRFQSDRVLVEKHVHAKFILFRGGSFSKFRIPLYFKTKIHINCLLFDSNKK